MNVNGRQPTVSTLVDGVGWQKSICPRSVGIRLRLAHEWTPPYSNSNSVNLSEKAIGIIIGAAGATCIIGGISTVATPRQAVSFLPGFQSRGTFGAGRPSGRALKEENTPMARPPSGKLRRRAEW